MRINEMIRARRLAKNLTQEQMASYLGVTAPAVNKWEKGASCPDIGILPALARLLDTDLNTLLSFEDDLSDKEIGLFANLLSETLDKEGYRKSFDLAMAKIREYPTCYPLLLNVALLLDGALMMSTDDEEAQCFQAEIDGLYQRVLGSSDPLLSNQARAMLISKFMGRKEYDKARELLEALPEVSPVDRKQLEANLHIACGELDAAAKLAEEKLLSALNEVHGVLMTLMEIALKENRREDAAAIADVAKKGAELFDLWEYTSYAAPFMLYVSEKNRDGCIDLLRPMLTSLLKKWDIRQSPLYRHLDDREPEAYLGPKMQKVLIQSICIDEQTAFLKDSEDVQRIFREIGGDDFK